MNGGTETSNQHRRVRCAPPACRHRLTAAQNFMASLSNGAADYTRSRAASPARAPRMLAHYRSNTLADTSPHRGTTTTRARTPSPPLGLVLASEVDTCSQPIAPHRYVNNVGPVTAPLASSMRRYGDPRTMK